MELPLEFREYAAAALGDEIAGELCANIESHEELTSVRVNPFKGRSLGGDEPVQWSALGHYLSSRPVFTLDPLFHAGGYYVQEASSMYMELVKDAI